MCFAFVIHITYNCSRLNPIACHYGWYRGLLDVIWLAIYYPPKNDIFWCWMWVGDIQSWWATEGAWSQSINVGCWWYVKASSYLVTLAGCRQHSGMVDLSRLKSVIVRTGLRRRWDCPQGWAWDLQNVTSELTFNAQNALRQWCLGPGRWQYWEVVRSWLQTFLRQAI